MNSLQRPPRSRRPSLYISTSRKHESTSNVSTDYIECIGGGALTPDVTTVSSPPAFQLEGGDPNMTKVGKYLVMDGKESSTAGGVVQSRRAFHVDMQKEFVIKILPLGCYRELLASYWSVGNHPNVGEIREILLDSRHAYVIFERHFEDLHAFIRRKQRVKEPEAALLFRQIVYAVRHCHGNGIILRDLKLRKFLFTDKDRTHLSLDGLEEAHVLDDDTDDRMTDKHGCLAYVCPEILSSTDGYSGKSADVWSLGVVLYTMLVGQYPFHDSDVGVMFRKIRQGCYAIPDTVSPLGKCLIRNLLRREPSERLTVKEILKHPWFNSNTSKTSFSSSNQNEVYFASSIDQSVPELEMDEMSFSNFNLLPT